MLSDINPKDKTKSKDNKTYEERASRCDLVAQANALYHSRSYTQKHQYTDRPPIVQRVQFHEVTNPFVTSEIIRLKITIKQHTNEFTLITLDYTRISHSYAVPCS